MADVSAYVDALARRAEVHGAKIDALLPDGTHRYWSTHCRHGNHEACSADFIEGESAFVGDVRRVLVKRRPACCKTCGAPCVCTGCDHSFPDPSAEGGNHG